MAYNPNSIAAMNESATNAIYSVTTSIIGSVIAVYVILGYTLYKIGMWDITKHVS